MRTLEDGAGDFAICSCASDAPTFEEQMEMSKIIYIDRYETVLEKGGEIAYYAVKGTGKAEQRWRMPACFAAMYNEHHLAISPRTDCPMPEMYAQDGDFWVPRCTDA